MILAAGDNLAAGVHDRGNPTGLQMLRGQGVREVGGG